MKRKKKSGNITTVLLSVLFLAGLSFLLYPTVSNWWNNRNQSHAIEDYTQSVNELNAEKYAALREDAENYNRVLRGSGSEFELPEDFLPAYESLLNVSGNGIMGYVEIPAINCSLPIYHGTDDAVLQVAIGHLEWSSLPVGGESTHSVISGHRGLPSAELLTHIDKLEIGDRFYIHVLNETLEYRVDNVAVVEPYDTELLRITEGKDYMTLVTCTPYGINSHRLLVRGERVESGSAPVVDGQLQLSNEIRPVHLMYVIPVALVLIVSAAGILLWIDYKRRNVYHGKRVEKRSGKKQKGEKDA